MSIDEAGTSSGRSVADKNSFINDYWSYIGTHDIRMAVWFNTDKNPTPAALGCDASAQEQPWAIFNTDYGDDTFSSFGVIPLWHGFSAYRAGVQSNSNVVSAFGDPLRYISDARFLGQ